MEIRHVKTEQDAVSASRIYALSWKTAYRNLLSDRLLDELPLDDWIPKILNSCATGEWENILLCADGQDIGVGCYGRAREDDSGNTGEIVAIYLLPERWGTGYAAPLLRYMVEQLREAGCTRVVLWTLRDNLRARRFYEKQGFSATGQLLETTIRDERAVIVEYQTENRKNK